MSRSSLQVRFIRRSPLLGLALIVTACLTSTVSAQSYGAGDGAPDPRGDAAMSVLGGLGGAATAGGLAWVTYAWTKSACRDETGTDPEAESDCEMGSGYVVAATFLAAPFLISAGVTLAGDATGGTGGYWATFLGFAGLLPGILLLSVANAPELIGLGVALLPIGYITGAVIGYRWSADDPPTTPGASVALVPLRDGAMFSLSGGF